MIKYIFFSFLFFSIALFGNRKEDWKIFDPPLEPTEEELQERAFLNWGESNPYSTSMFINSINHKERTIETSWGIDLKVVGGGGGFKDLLAQWKEGDEIYFYRPHFEDRKSKDIGLKNRTLGNKWTAIIRIIRFDPEFPGTMILQKEDMTVELGDGSRWSFSWIWKDTVKKWSEGQHLVPIYPHSHVMFGQWWMINLETGEFIKANLEKKPKK